MNCAICSRGVEKQIAAAWPSDPAAAVDAEAMNALTLTALSNPQKLPRIGSKLSSRSIRHIQRADYAAVAQGMQIFDGLIGACHTNLHLFDRSFLDVLTALLESRNHKLQMLGANAFSKVGHIKRQRVYCQHFFLGLWAGGRVVCKLSLKTRCTLRGCIQSRNNQNFSIVCRYAPFLPFLQLKVARIDSASPAYAEKHVLFLESFADMCWYRGADST